MFSTDAVFLEYFHLQLFEFVDVEPMNTEAWVYLTLAMLSTDVFRWGEPKYTAVQKGCSSWGRWGRDG
jgi:hypothetical protein